MATDYGDEKRVCPDDGKVYTFEEFEIAYCFSYSSSELDAKWVQMEKIKQNGPSKDLDISVEKATPFSGSKHVDTSIVKLAEHGEVIALKDRLSEGCDPNVFAFEYLRHGGSKRVYCNDWTPLTAAVVAGRIDFVEMLLSGGADVNVVCCTTTTSGAYKSWSALDCARTGEIIPFERDPSKDLQPRYPAIERILLANGAKPASSLATPEFNTYGELPGEEQRSNPCVDDTGDSFKPSYLFSEAELSGYKGQPSLVLGGSCVCPGVAIKRDGASESKVDRVYHGGCRAFK